MSISAETLFDQKKSQFGAEAQHTLFVANFVTAVNRTTDEYANSMDLDEPDHIDDIESTIDVDEHHEYAISEGVDYWLIKLGHRLGETTPKEAKADFEKALAKIRTGRDMGDQRAEDEAQVFGMITSD